ncbi:MAG: ABC transporter ATP-binding protein/permease [Clostridiales bacterium]|nr:ABC transporter ATP-binding protein/permease [Clostridiales bacterium]MDD7121068.1 ABC transporter ATP-binding protein/permease [Clostridiales bacterium]MDY5467835.1 ABC transporter ATP-binding protein/permease [Eubacteriales bacterium]
MLTLSNIHKEYASGELRVEALKGVSLSFRKNEFVAVLGPSGCGKTTLLNIIGGLDRYTQGDLIIKGRSTREYKDADWDSYRNHSVGFVFQSYNLIPHQTVLSNVELALTLGGVPAKERRRRAVQALERVGLGDQLNKKPNEMSGGQMQRVAIARALVNDPEILLADEPTGALDSETSVQIMDVLKEIATDRLVIMVTHNPELAAQYATRTIRLLDGRVTDDTMPFDGQDDMAQPPARTGATSMHFGTALHLSLNNLMTKKGRTFMVALAGSIGIIGIALILSLSNGVNEYIKSVEEDTLAQYPLTIESETMNQSALLTAMMSASSGKDIPHEEGRVYSSNVMGDLMSAMVSEVNANDLPSFKAYLDGSQEIADLTSSIAYEYGSTLRIYNRNAVGGVQQVQPSTVIDTMTNSSMMSNANALASMSSMSSLSQMTSMYNMNVFFELAGPSVHRSGSYELLAGHMPQKYDELLLVVGEDDDISDTTLYTLGLRDQSEVQQLFMTLLTGSTVQTETISYSYDDLLNLTFTLVLPGNLYQEQGDGIYADISGDEAAMSQALDHGVTLHIAGIARSSSNSMISSMMAGGVGYTHELVEYVVSANNETPAVKAQRAHPDTDIFTGINFSGGVDMEPSMEMLDTYLNSLPQEQQTAVRAMIGMMSEERILSMMRAEMAKQKTDATYESNLAKLNATNLDTPTQIKIYPIDFESKQRIVDLIEQYNAQMQAAGHEEGVIRYTDYVGSLMSSVTTIVDTISYVLIAFVSISLVVSSIMIGIITYISVLERTKEIGILRAMGASKGDVSRVFTAETLIIGLVAGFLGVLVTWLLTFPINALIHHLTQINAAAILPGGAAAILVAISMLLTILAGAIPSRMAAKKDPVVALRTE